MSNQRDISVFGAVMVVIVMLMSMAAGAGYTFKLLYHGQTTSPGVFLIALIVAGGSGCVSAFIGGVVAARLLAITPPSKNVSE